MKRLLLALWLCLAGAAAHAQCNTPGGQPSTIIGCPTAVNFQTTDYLLGMQAFNGTTILQQPGRTVKVQPLQLAQLIGGGSGAGSSFGSAFPSTGTAVGVKNGANMVNLNADGNGNLLTSFSGTLNNGSSGLASSSTNAGVIVWPYGWNGSSWDQLQVDGSKNLKVTVTTTLPAGSQVNIRGNLGGAMDAAGQNAASPANELLMAGQFNTSPTSITSGNVSPIQLDANGKVLMTASQATGTNLHMVCDSGCSSSTAPADEATFTAGTTSQSPIGGFFQTSATSNPLTNGKMGAVQMTANRAFFTNLRDSSGNEEGLAGQPLQVSLANTAANATAVSVSINSNAAVNLAQVNGVTTLAGAGATGTGAQRVTASQDTTTIAGSAPGAAGTASANVVTVQGVASMTPLAVTAAQATGTNLHMVCDSGCSGSTAPADESAFTAGTTPQGTVGGFFQTTATSNPLTNGQMGAMQLTANRALMTNLRTSAGVETGIAAAPLQVSLANTAANATSVAVSIANGLSKFSEVVPANTTAVVVKASAGTFYGIDGFSISASTPIFVKLYDATSATCGTGTPVLRYAIPASGGAAASGLVEHTNGDTFSTGITMCVTADLVDNTANAPAANSYILNVHYK